MYKRYKERFGTAGVVLGVIALILALGGTALAASKLNGTQKKEVEKIAKKYAGKPGAPGPPGTAGTNGTNGKDGAAGTAGKDGSNGTPGAAGKSVEVIEGAGSCPEGGTTVQVAGEPATAEEVCNGVEGPPGAIHPGETLPSKATETGTMIVQTPYKFPAGTVSFPIPLESVLEEEDLHYIAEGASADECENPEQPGTASATNPEAKPGQLCVFGEYESQLEFLFFGAMTKTGGQVGFVFTGTLANPLDPQLSEMQNSIVIAHYAVTAP